MSGIFWSRRLFASKPRAIEARIGSRDVRVALWDLFMRRVLSRDRRVPFVSRTCCILIAAVMLMLTGLSHPAAAAEFETVEIATKSGVQVFAVEVAKTDEERRTGLMYRKELPEGRGMLFDFSPAQEVTMWMKNTYVSLDMIFIGSDGRILRIAENTEPLSTRVISSGGPAKGVLEVVAGTARKFGIAPGDRVAHPLFGKR